MLINGHYPVYQDVVHVESNTVIAQNAKIANQHKLYHKRLLELYQVWLSVENAPSTTVIVPISFRSLVDMLVTGRLEQLTELIMRSQTICFEIYDMEAVMVHNHLERINQVRALGFQLSLKDVTNSFETGQLIVLLQPNILRLSEHVIVNRDGGFIDRLVDISNQNNLKVIATGIDTYNDFIYLKQTKCLYGQGKYLEKISATKYKAIG